MAQADGELRSCCAPASSPEVVPLGRAPTGPSTASSAPRSPGAEASVRGLDLVPLPGGEFRMGGEDPDGYPEDGEGPVRAVRVAPFAIARSPVTNREFARFVAATDHRTDAERTGWSFVFHLLVPASAREHVLDAAVAGVPWWLPVRGARWAEPDGPGSTWVGREDHPVVHVSYRDAQEFCAWAGVRLPREAEWEYAARGGLDQARFPWGDELHPAGRHVCNIWQGEFPGTNTAADGFVGTSPVGTYPPNGFGLHDVAGNVWELCDEPWSVPAGPGRPDELAIRGGSYLCHDSYCTRYRVAARTRTTIDSTSGNTGFRVAGDG